MRSIPVVFIAGARQVSLDTRIYSGAQTLPLSERIWAVPVSALWI